MTADSPLVLVVEDEPGTATLHRRRLERAGFRVAVASDVDSAMDALVHRAVRVVVLDYRLGTTTGLHLNRRMKAAGFDVPVIIVTGAIDETSVIEAIRGGIKDVVVKNLDYLDALPDTVRGVLGQSAVPELSAPAGSTTRVLIVEDDPGMATLERRQLERSGYAVDTVATVEEAMSRVRKGDVHLTLLDLRLDDGRTSGLELYEQIRAEGFNIPAILVTAFPDQAVAIRALRAGIRDFVPKSNEFLDYLPGAVDRVMAQVRMERKLVESELRLTSVVGTAMDAIVMCNEDLKIVLFNRAAEDMFGCSAADANERPLSSLIPDLDIAAPSDSVSRGGAVRQRREVEAVTISGRIPIEVSISDVVVNGRRLFTVIARDISERRRNEAELREADRRKDVFLGMLAHELRNPLAAVMSAGEMLHRTIEQPGAQKLIAVIRRQAAALARMVDDLLDVSRVTLGKIQLAREPVLVSEVVTRSADVVRDAAAAAQIHLEVVVDPEPVWVTGDPTRLEQVVVNLLNNAVKFTPAGGTITVTTASDASAAVIRVRDTGLGMEPPLLQKAFDLFVQGDSSLDRGKGGLGLGLALVKQVVALHGGQVSAASAGPGRGSEFEVRLPPLLQEAVVNGTPAPTAIVESGSMRVLVVDDQPDLADCIALLIGTLGHRAQAVYGGVEALAVSRSDPPDVMLVDIGMPGMTGLELAAAVRRDPVLAHIRLVALTGYGRDEDRARVLEAGFDLHLTKPVADAKLREALEQVAPAPPRAR